MTHLPITTLLALLTREGALLTVKETSHSLGVTEWWTRQLIARGDLRAINVGGTANTARWRVDPEDLRAFLANRESRSRDLMAS
ncbi:helix-turn-helix domain-containing protein [Microterricola pindariensis]